MPGQGFSGLANWNRFLQNPAQYGYWDTYGAGVLPGGNLRASPDQWGNPRSLPGVEFPGTPDPGIANDPVYGNTLGIPRVSLEGGGPGAYGRYPYPDMNIPTNEDVAPNLTTTYYIDPSRNPYVNPSANSYPDLSGLPPVEVGASGVPRRYPDLSGLPPVMVTAPNWPRAVATGGYPVPGGGNPANAAGNWARNAARGGLYSGGFGSVAAANLGFGSGLASLGGGGWQTVSEFPTFSGFAAPVGRSSAGPLQP